MSEDIIRDWQPGDGLRCVYASRAPQGIPCGPPVKTRVSEQFGKPRASGKTIVRRPVCANHVQAGGVPGKVRAEADRLARQRVLHEHWDEYEKYLAEATAAVLKEYEEKE